MIVDPFTDDPTIRAPCDTLSPDEHQCSCGHGIQDHAEWNSLVGACEVCECPAYGEA